MRAIDPAGNPDLTPASRSFTVLGGPQITSGPAGLTNDNTPTFTFTGTGTFTCRVDTAAFATCISPFTTAALTDGAHTFDVRDSTSTTASRTFTVDATPPDTTITGTALPLTFSSGEQARFECSLDGAAFTACSTPYAPTGLAAGQHTVDVRAIDGANNVDATPASRTFTVGAPATITDGPPEVTDNPTPTFTFTATDAQCSLDDAPFTACSSPYTTPALASGAHKFAVRSAANPTVATRTFTVSVPQQQTPTPVPTVQPTPTPSATPTPTPVPNQSVVAQPASGTVCVKRPGSSTCVPLTAGQSIPLNSTVDTRKGTVEITASADRQGEVLRRHLQGHPEGRHHRPRAGRDARRRARREGGKRRREQAQEAQAVGRRQGQVPHQGKYSAATVRGTKWLVEDSCAGTLTKVDQGVVQVHDNVTRKNVTVRAKKSYTAKPKR